MYIYIYIYLNTCIFTQSTSLTDKHITKITRKRTFRPILMGDFWRLMERFLHELICLYINPFLQKARGNLSKFYVCFCEAKFSSLHFVLEYGLSVCNYQLVLQRQSHCFYSNDHLYMTSKLQSAVQSSFDKLSRPCDVVNILKVQVILSLG